MGVFEGFFCPFHLLRSHRVNILSQSVKPAEPVRAMMIGLAQRRNVPRDRPPWSMSLGGCDREEPEMSRQNSLKRNRAEAEAADDTAPRSRMKRKEFESELRKLQVKLVRLQAWVKATGARVIVIFEGRDTAGKGGVISRITQRVSPRVFRHIALPAPTEREKSQLYIQRYMAHFPAAGEIVLFDRSWYNRAGVEKVMGFCSKEEHERFMRLLPSFEREIVDNGIILLKYFL